MKLTFEVEVPEKELKNYLRAAGAYHGRDYSGANFPWDLERFSKYVKKRKFPLEVFRRVLIEATLDYSGIKDK